MGEDGGEGLFAGGGFGEMGAGINHEWGTNGARMGRDAGMGEDGGRWAGGIVCRGRFWGDGGMGD